MTSSKQLQANRQNALKSTGPRSPVGKMIASLNSTRHGFYSTSVLLPQEDREEFLRLARHLVSAYTPGDVLEEESVRSIIETHWQLRRANLVDSELFQIYAFYQGENRGVGTAFAQDSTQGNAFSKLTHYQNFLLRKLRQAERELWELKARSNQALANSHPSGLPNPALPEIVTDQLLGAPSPQVIPDQPGSDVTLQSQIAWRGISRRGIVQLKISGVAAGCDFNVEHYLLGLDRAQ